MKQQKKSNDGSNKQKEAWMSPRGGATPRGFGRVLPELQAASVAEPAVLDTAAYAGSWRVNLASTTPRSARGSLLEPLSSPDGAALKSHRESRGGGGTREFPDVDPSPRPQQDDEASPVRKDGDPPIKATMRLRGLDTKFGDPVAMMALEDWANIHGAQHGQHANYKSQLVYCEAQLRKLEHLCESVKPPHPAVTALSMDLLRTTCMTLPPQIHKACEGLLKLLEAVVYSDEALSPSDAKQLQKVVPACSDRVPHFILARRQQTELEELRSQVDVLRKQVQSHMDRRQRILDFLVRLQREDRLVLQQWLFRFWHMTFQYRQSRIARIMGFLTREPDDIVTPFVYWRLYVSQVRYERITAECHSVDMEASRMANKITEVEIENEAQQKKLHDAMAANASLKEKCIEEQLEHERLQSLWDATQPELLLAVLGQSLELFFSQVVRIGRLSRIASRQQLSGKDPAPLLIANEGPSEATPEGQQEGGSSSSSPPSKAAKADAESLTSVTLLLRWFNIAIDKAKKEGVKAAKAQALGGKQKGGSPAVAEEELAALAAHPPLQNLDADLADGKALCILFAVLKSRMHGNDVRPKDLAPLAERDDAARVSQVCNMVPKHLLNVSVPSLLTAEDVALGNTRAVHSLLAACFLKEPLLDTIPESSLGSDEAKASQAAMDVIMGKVHAQVGDELHAHIEDPSLLLQGGEDYHSLTALSTERLLLRWVNVQLQHSYHKPIENFAHDLQDCEALAKLLSVLAPEVSGGDGIPDSRDKRLDMLVTTGLKCTGTDIFTSAAIMEEQPDMLAAFLAQLFLVRPNLRARPISLLSMHVGILEKVCTDGYQVLQKPVDTFQVMKFCKSLESQWPEVTLALHTVQDANRTMEGIRSRMSAFLGETLALRAQGEPRTMLDAKEAREFLLYTSLSADRVQGFLTKEFSEAATRARIEELLRKHFRLLRDIFWYYSKQEGLSSGAGITLEGLLKLYQDCKLRARELAPQHIEAIFYEHLDAGYASERALSPPSLIVVLLRCASIKFKIGVSALPDQFSYMIEQHLKPYACQDTGTVFQRMAYDKKVREVLQTYTVELKLIFEVYARADVSTAEAAQRVNTMNISEFQLLLSHAKLLDENLTEQAVQQIFLCIQKTVADGGEDDAADVSGLDDDDELAFSEFQDGLVAIAAYINPDPFVAFSSRVNGLILQLFAALRRYWSRRKAAAQVDEMVNILQKRLR